MRTALTTAIAAVLLAGGCASTAEENPEPPAPGTSAEAPAATPTPRPRLRIARCAPDAANCRAVIGRVITVEAVDPDGDGDAHYILAGGSVTAPGITIVDVAPQLRPRRIPRLGDRVSAAGPVHTGSHGQKQIQAKSVFQLRR